MSKINLKPIEVDMIIISYAKNKKLYQETLLCIDTLIKSEDSNVIKFNLIIVESKKDISYNNIYSLGHTIKTIYTDKEFGYHTYLNVGREHASAEWSCLCNNDLIFKPKWASNIIGIINAQRKIDPIAWKYVSASPANPKEEWHKENLGMFMVGFEIRKHIAGWCLFQSSNIFEKIGKLEEKIKFWFCDNWYSVVLQHYKIPHLFVGNSIVEHHNNTEGTTTENIDLPIAEKHNLTFGAGDNFRQIIRELFDNPNWGKITDVQKQKLKESGKEFY